MRHLFPLCCRAAPKNMSWRQLSLLGDPGSPGLVRRLLSGASFTWHVDYSYDLRKSTPEVAIWVVDGSSPLTWAASAHKLAAMLSSGELQPCATLIIAINKTFRNAVQVFSVINLKE
ncbi:hypothetical protein LB504_009794, partial [Fusarium proliferatum]